MNTEDSEFKRIEAEAKMRVEQQAEPPPEWPLIKNILAEYGLDAISFVAEWKAAQQQTEGQEHMKHEKTFDAIGKLKDIELELHRLKNALEMANKGLDAQRPWVGLTPDEVKHLYPYGRSIWGKETFEAIEKALRSKNT